MGEVSFQIGCVSTTVWLLHLYSDWMVDEKGWCVPSCVDVEQILEEEPYKTSVRLFFPSHKPSKKGAQNMLNMKDLKPSKYSSLFDRFIVARVTSKISIVIDLRTVHGFMNDLFQWTTTWSHRTAKTSIHQSCTDTRYYMQDLTSAMAGSEGERERERELKESVLLVCLDDHISKL